MHFEILIEDQSGKRALDVLVPKIIGDGHTYRVIAYKGIGHIPKNLKSADYAANRALLSQLPRILQGYGRSLNAYEAAVIVVCDLDNRCLSHFRQELLAVLSNCTPRPVTRFCIAVEEVEAWLLGDPVAVKRAYPKAKEQVLNSYEYDSICGTWELLANAVYNGGAAKLKSQPFHVVGKEKSKWAEHIAPHIDPERNASPSFQYFRGKLLALTAPQS